MSADQTADCTAQTPICRWRMQFYSWGQGYCGVYEVQGAPVSDKSESQPDTVKLEATVLQNKITISATGTIQ